MLLEDEQNIISWLSMYGALPVKQLHLLLQDKTLQQSDRIIRNLKKSQLISPVGDGYYLGLDPLCKPDQRMVLAIWVLLYFIQDIDPHAHYPADFPAQIFFLKENVGYEIIVFFEGEEHLSKLLQPQDENMKYIIAVPDIRMVSKMTLPDRPCLFVTVAFKGDDIPDVLFYHEEAVLDG